MAACFRDFSVNRSWTTLVPLRNNNIKEKKKSHSYYKIKNVGKDIEVLTSIIYKCGHVASNSKQQSAISAEKKTKQKSLYVI